MNSNHGDSINLHIEQLVLDGFPARDHGRIVSAVRGELHRLFSSGGLPPILDRSADIGRLDGGEIRIGRGDTAEAIGKRTARSLYRGLQQ